MIVKKKRGDAISSTLHNANYLTFVYVSTYDTSSIDSCKYGSLTATIFVFRACATNVNNNPPNNNNAGPNSEPFIEKCELNTGKTTQHKSKKFATKIINPAITNTFPLRLKS